LTNLRINLINIKNDRLLEMKKYFKYRKSILLLPLLASMGVCSEPLPFMLMTGEGGAQSPKAKLSFEAHMAESDCSVKVSFVNNTVKGSALSFSAKPLSNNLIDKGVDEDKNEYESLAQIRTYKNYPLTSAVLVKASTGISDLKSIEGERLSVISKTSYLGWEVIQGLYHDASTEIDGKDIYETGGYEGAIALLLHGDVFSAALPGPLARRWLTANMLTIVAESDVLNIGEVWVKKELSEVQKKLCRKALISLERTTRRDKRMSIFPAWVEGFK
jgi:ABC-type phosphate/phosphonate transport system substrate-binding protein